MIGQWYNNFNLPWDWAILYSYMGYQIHDHSNDKWLDTVRTAGKVSGRESDGSYGRLRWTFPRPNSGASSHSTHCFEWTQKITWPTVARQHCQRLVISSLHQTRQNKSPGTHRASESRITQCVTSRNKESDLVKHRVCLLHTFIAVRQFKEQFASFTTVRRESTRFVS